jgi:hypothetical protein
MLSEVDNLKKEIELIKKSAKENKKNEQSQSNKNK